MKLNQKRILEKCPYFLLIQVEIVWRLLEYKETHGKRNGKLSNLSALN